MSISTAPTAAPAKPAPPPARISTPDPAPAAVSVTVVTAPAPVAPVAPAAVTVWHAAALAALLGWAYFPMLRVFFDKWANDPQYSHGFLVPFFSAYLLWKGRGEARPGRALPWAGGALLVVALAMRAVAGSLLFHQLDAASFLLGLAAVALAAGGWAALRRTGPAILFLGFMVPLPYELERNVGQPLKTAATVSSTFLLQTLGQPAIRDANLILIDEAKIGVVDACSGLKMMVTFAAFSVGAALLMRRSRFEKLMILLGIIPIAVAANVLRIAATGLVAHLAMSDKSQFDFLHELFGYFMMPVGLALLGVEVWVLKRLVIDPVAAG